ncbi:hypothetical protein L2755_20745 [Shewanella abyssi]|uniref:hypothetical protein n=1 Tax=Shewanella TaxID=22 RepID=UPI0005C86B36|nr:MULTISPECIES: hypothetical protein [Shewanella]MCL1052026.1 hypothetical protein [Shewanella abyssi]
MDTLITKYFYQVCGALLVTLSVSICFFLVLKISPPNESMLKEINGPIDKIEYTDNQFIISIGSLSLTYEKWNGDITNVTKFLSKKINDNVDLLVYFDQSDSGKIYSVHVGKVPVRTLKSVLEHRRNLIASIVMISILCILLGLAGISFGGRIAEMNKSIM